ncbi:MAG: NAD(P)/FAD-dependent oxidoreductase [Solirubrobacterales bacterium]
MSKSGQTFVIVGAGLAGAKAAEGLRAHGFEGRIVLVGAEDVRPYERPPLSKEYLRGESEREKLFVHDESRYRREEIEMRLGGAATALDLAARELELADGKRLGFDRLLLATGAEPRRLAVPGAELDGVCYLRSLESCEAIRERLARGGRVVVIGAGWIGTEAAASARQLGLEVVVIDPASTPLERVLGSRLGALYGEVHREHGVELMMGTGVEAFEGGSSLERVRTSDGGTVECDFAIVGVGVEPRSELARSAGLAVEDGVLVDATLQTSHPAVFAAGDVAGQRHPIFGQLRVEHWATALHQGTAAARNMLGRAEPYERVPYFFSDQYELGMEYAGFAKEAERMVIRGDPASRELIAFWLGDDRVLAGMNLNVWDVSETIQRLVAERTRVDAATLADPDVALQSLLAEPSS